MTSRLISALSVVLVISLACVSGWVARGWKADADIALIRHEQDQEFLERYRHTMSARKEAEAAGQDASRKYESRLQEISSFSNKLKTELRHAEKQASNPACRLPDDWVRLYDASLRAGGDTPATAGKPADQATGTAPADAGAAISEWDVAWIHAENSARWAACRQQLNALIDFETDLRVVTP